MVRILRTQSIQSRSSAPVSIHRFAPGGADFQNAIMDQVAVEEPLEIRLNFERDGASFEQTISITMRTPDADIDLALGFLFSEGVIQKYDEVVSASHCGPGVPDKNLVNVVKVVLQPGCSPDPQRLLRNIVTSSGCGVCGKTSIDALELQSQFQSEADPFRINTEQLLSLPQTLRDRQSAFLDTGGLHGAGLFDNSGSLHQVMEDVGRHNALDKLVGCSLRRDHLPWREQGVLLSGRISFELVQKVAMAGGSLIAAIGAPSSLAIEAAAKFDITLVGFLKATGFNIYGDASRFDA